MSIISFRCHTTIHLAPLVNQETIHQDMDRGQQLMSRINQGILRPLINDFLRKMAKFRHQENQDVSAGTRIRFFIDKPAAMISFPRAVIKYL